MDALKAILNDDGVFEEYDDTYDLTIHCTSQEDLDKTIKILQERTWITDRDPTPEEVEQAGDVGFIICISGKLGACVYQHAIDMTENYYENGHWYLHGVGLDDNVTVHGWMLPPVWED